MPADHRLRRRFAVLRRDAEDGGIAQQLPPSERAPGFCPDPMLVVKRSQGPLLKPGMKLDLIDCRRDPGLPDDALEVIPIEIRYADRAAAAFALKTDERLPALHVTVEPRSRPMDEVEVERMAAELPGALLEGAQSFVETVVRVPELRRDEDVRPAVQRLADALLVAIGRRRVDGAIPDIDGLFDYVCCDLWRGLKDAESELRHRSAVVENDSWLVLNRHGPILELAGKLANNTRAQSIDANPRAR